ncbi:hypothetical protein ES705_43342 [subsurface metagenome]
MGTPVPLFMPGALCPWCWGFDKPFVCLFTNKYIGVNISGVVKGPDWEEGDGEPDNSYHTLTQSESVPCEFFHWGEPGYIRLRFYDIATQFEARNAQGRAYFFVDNAPLCEELFTNTLQFHFTGGTAQLLIPGYNI